MQTSFSLAQLADPNIADAEAILRNCVHCGFCTATCPTYVTLGNEMDSPRGRIYLIKDMLENDRAADETTVKHIDRCLSCLSCMSTCPSGVHYMHLVDHARTHIEKTYKRPLMQRMIRHVLGFVLPDRQRFSWAITLAKMGKPFAPLFDRFASLKPLAAMLRLAPLKRAPQSAYVMPGRFPPSGAAVFKNKTQQKRVALLTGCAQPVLDSTINKATIELLNRLNIEVILPKDEACCGALVHHMGHEEKALEAARHMVNVWHEELQNNGLDAIIMTTSGCGTVVKDYGHMLRHDEQWAEKAARVSALAQDISEYLVQQDLPQVTETKPLTVAYHGACSLQHGQKVTTAPKALLEQAGYTVKAIKDAHLCCGSAGTYNILQSDIATQLKTRKVASLEAVEPDVIAGGNIGCITQIASGTDIPTVHTVQLLNWAYGGEKPEAL